MRFFFESCSYFTTLIIVSDMDIHKLINSVLIASITLWIHFHTVVLWIPKLFPIMRYSQQLDKKYRQIATCFSTDTAQWEINFESMSIWCQNHLSKSHRFKDRFRFDHVHNFDIFSTLKENRPPPSLYSNICRYIIKGIF